MKSKDIFSLAVRILGLVFLYHGLMTLIAIIPVIFLFNINGLIISLLMAVAQFMAARWLLCGAPWIMRIAYPDPGTDENPE